MTAFSPSPRRGARAHVPCYGGRVETSDFKELLEAREKSGTLGREGFMVNGEGQGGGPCFLLVLRGAGPLRGVRAQEPGGGCPAPPSPAWEPGPRCWWLRGHRGSRAMTTLAAHPCINSEWSMATMLKDKPETLPGRCHSWGSCTMLRLRWGNPEM